MTTPHHSKDGEPTDKDSLTVEPQEPDQAKQEWMHNYCKSEGLSMHNHWDREEAEHAYEVTMDIQEPEPEPINWQARAEKAEAELKECAKYHDTDELPSEILAGLHDLLLDVSDDEACPSGTMVTKVDALKHACSDLRETARVLKLDSEELDEWKEAVREIGQVIGCDHGHEGLASCLRSTIDEKDEELSASRAEVRRLRAALTRSNVNHEKFERLWYLRGDVLEDIAKQKIGDEMDEEMQESADYEGAYEEIVKECRKCMLETALSPAEKGGAE